MNQAEKLLDEILLASEQATPLKSARRRMLEVLERGLAEQPALATYTCGVCGVSMQMEQPLQMQSDPSATLHPELYCQTWNAMHPDMAVAEQPAQQDSPWCMKMNGCKTKCEDCPDEVQNQTAQQKPMAWIERDMNCDDFDPDSVTCQKPDIAAQGWEWVPLYTAPQARQDSPWCMKMNGCKTKCEDCPDEAPKIGCVNHDCDKCKAQQEPLTDALWGLLDAVENELNRRAIPEAWLLMAHKAGRAYIESRGITKGNT